MINVIFQVASSAS